MDKFTVSGVPVDSDILPTIRPIGSVLGDDRSILDTPRSVSSVDAAWMTDRDVDKGTLVSHGEVVALPFAMRMGPLGANVGTTS